MSAIDYILLFLWVFVVGPVAVYLWAHQITSGIMIAKHKFLKKVNKENNEKE